MKKREVKPGVAPAPPGDGEFSLIPDSKLLDLYVAMLKCRVIADAISKQKKGIRSKQTPPLPAAITTGVTIDLEASDAISPMARDLAPCSVKGVALKAILRWCAHPSARVPVAIARANIIPPAASNEARFEAALRLAAHFRFTNSNSVVVCFAGQNNQRTKTAAPPDNSRAQLEQYLCRAASKQLPVLFVLQSEGKASDRPSSSTPCDIPCMVVDQDDVVAVYRAATEALTHARRGNGPTMIECQPWVLKERGRKSSAPRSSVGKMELYLAGKGLAFRSIKNKSLKEFAAELKTFSHR